MSILEEILFIKRWTWRYTVKNNAFVTFVPGVYV